MHNFHNLSASGSCVSGPHRGSTMDSTGWLSSPET